MSIATITHKFAFGLKADVAQNLSYLSDGRLVYPVGNTVVIYSPHQEGDEMSNTQSFPPDRSVQDTGEGITALATCPRYVAIAERGEHPTVQLYDIIHTHNKKRKMLVSTEHVAKEFVSIAFSRDAKIMITLGGAPDHVLSYWLLDRERAPLVQIKVCTKADEVATLASFHPHLPDIICVTGLCGLMRLFKFVEDTNELKPIGPSRSVEGDPSSEIANYVCHRWVSDDILLLGTDTGKIAVVNGFELTHDSVPYDPSHSGDTSAITCIASYSRGFVIGTDASVVRVYELEEGEAVDNDGTNFKEIAALPLPVSDARVCHLVLGGPAPEANIAITTDRSQIYICKDFQSKVVGQESPEDAFELLGKGFHQATVTGMDICVRKSLVVTCSTDKTVRVWNFATNTCELAKLFPEEASAVAMHPAGLKILVGFSDKLHLMNLLVDDIVTEHEFSMCRGCREVRFSNGGHLFAAMRDNLIFIFNTYTYERLPDLMGHNGKVRSIFWAVDDSKLISAGMEGAIYEWDLSKPPNSNRTDMNVDKKCHYTSAVRTNDGSVIYAVGDNKKLKEITAADTCREISTGRVPCVYTQIAISRNNRMMFVGTANGTVRSLKYPIPPGPGGEYLEMVFHCSPVTRLAISHDEKFLFSTGEDGALFISHVRDGARDLAGRDVEVPFSEEILITKAVLRKKDEAYEALCHSLENERSSWQFAATNAKAEATALEVQLKARHQGIHDELRSQNYHLRMEKDHLQQTFEEKIEKLKESNNRVSENEKRANDELTLLSHEKQLKLEQKMEDQAVEWDREKLEMQQQLDEEIEDLIQEHMREIRKKDDQLRLLEEATVQAHREYEETRRQVEEDADEEIQNRIDHYQGMIDDRDEAMLWLKGQVGIFRKEFKQLKKANEDQKAKTQTADAKVASLEADQQKKDLDIRETNQRIQDRDTVIKKKEDTIHDLKKHNQELEKYKFVLEYRNKELTKQLEPRDEQINEQIRRINQMDKELEKFYKNNVTLNNTVGVLEQKVQSLERDILTQRSKINDANAVVKRWRTDLHECVQHIQDPLILRECCKSLYEKHVTLQVADPGIDGSIQRENMRHREFLDRSVVSLKHKLAADAEIHRTDNAAVMQENVALIKEIHDLRKASKQMKIEQRNMEASWKLRAATQKKPGGGRIPPGVAATLEHNDKEIKSLRAQIKAAEGLQRSRPMSTGSTRARPLSGTLPPVNGPQRSESARSLGRSSVRTVTPQSRGQSRASHHSVRSELSSARRGREAIV